MMKWFYSVTVLFWLAVFSAGAAEGKHFSWKENQLMIRSSRQSVCLSLGKICGIADTEGRIFIRSDRDDSTAKGMLQCRGKQALLSYDTTGEKLIYQIRVEKDGRMFLQPERRTAAGNLIPDQDLFFWAPAVSVITPQFGRMGGRPENFTGTVCYYDGPRMLLLEQPDGRCTGIWSDQPGPLHELVFRNKGSMTEVILRSCAPSRLKEFGNHASLEAAGWRIGIYDDWLTAVRAYRKDFSEATGIRPLWENASPWVRKIHAFTTWYGKPTVPARAAARARRAYRRLAKAADPSRLLLLYWNGDRIIRLGDHQFYPDRNQPYEVYYPELKKYGFHFMNYHPYVLIHEPGAENRYRKEGWRLPPGYRFTPDYDGRPENFDDWAMQFTSLYPQILRGYRLYVMNPAAKQVEDYLVRNIRGYVKATGADGVYLDVLGMLNCRHGSPDRKRFDDRNYVQGDQAFLEKLRRKDPAIALMSEYPSDWTLPWTFFSWTTGVEGASHPVSSHYMNHPLRGALTGSWCWLLEKSFISPVDSALMGCLPRFDITDRWSRVRGKLFMDEELFPDLPEKWSADAAMYYRGRNGWVVFRKHDWGYGYVKNGRIHCGVLHGASDSRALGSVDIPGHFAYDKDGCAIGLNPSAEYCFLPGMPKDDFGFVMESLPSGTFIDSYWTNREKNEWDYLTVHFGGSGEGGEVPIRFSQIFKEIWVGGRRIPAAGPGGRNVIRIRPGEGIVLLRSPIRGTDDLSTLFCWALEGSGKPSRLVEEKMDLCNYKGQQQAVKLGKDGVRIFAGARMNYAAMCRNIPAGNPVFSCRLTYTKPDLMYFEPVTLRLFVNGCQVWCRETDHAEGEKITVPLQQWAGESAVLTLAVSLRKNCRRYYARAGVDFTEIAVGEGGIR